MPSRNKRSRSMRKVFVKLAKGTKVKYSRRKCKIPVCSLCEESLKGMSKTFEFKLKNKSKTKKRASRPHANLCSACMRKKIIEGARKNV